MTTRVADTVLIVCHANTARSVMAHMLLERMLVVRGVGDVRVCSGGVATWARDGMMIFFNDPTPVPNPQERAVRMALEMRDRVDELVRGWRKRGWELDFGVGIAQGYATIGAIGFEGRWDYGAIGTVTNLAARLCGEAQPGQILVPRRLYGTLEDLVEAAPVGELALKGFSRAVSVYNVTALKPA